MITQVEAECADIIALDIGRGAIRSMVTPIRFIRGHIVEEDLLSAVIVGGDLGTGSAVDRDSAESVHQNQEIDGVLALLDQEVAADIMPHRHCFGDLHFLFGRTRSEQRDPVDFLKECLL